MLSNGKIGKRLIISVIDSYAINDPTRVWVSVPVDDDDLTKGFKDVTYKELANAVNHVCWSVRENFADSTSFETLAYAGPKDLRYPILALAAVKCGKQVY